MSQARSQALFALVESFFTNYLPRQRGASPHTIRAYRDTLKLLLQFAAQRHNREVAMLGLDDFDADMIAAFLDHLETGRSNSAATRNCRRAALRSFFKHLLRNDLDHALRYTQVLALPSKRARLRPRALSRSLRHPGHHRGSRPADSSGLARLYAAALSLQLRRTGQRGDGAAMG